MKKVSLLTLSLLIALVVISVGTVAAQPPDKNYVAHLTGSQEVPPVDNQFQGQAKFQLNGDQLTYRVNVSNLRTAVAAHIHEGAPGVNGGILVHLCGTGGQPPCGGPGVLATGTAMVSEAVIAAMNSGNTYVNVHTPANPGGEIRGQVRPIGP